MLVYQRVNRPSHPIKPPFSYGFPVVFLWFTIHQFNVPKNIEKYMQSVESSSDFSARCGPQGGEPGMENHRIEPVGCDGLAHVEYDIYH